MKSNKYFDEWKLNRAASYINTNPLVAKLRFEQYLKDYPKDYLTQIYYAAVLITLGEFNEAENILNHVEFLFNSDKQMANKASKETLKKVKDNIITSKMRLLSYQEKYNELHEYIQKYFYEIKSMGFAINPLLYYGRKKLGQIDENKREQHTYIFRQIIRYEEKDFLEHIKKHLSEYTDNTINPDISVFKKDFPLDIVIEEIKKHIPSDIRLYPNLYSDAYVFRYDNCGKTKNEEVHYFKVACFHNTNEIITIFPEKDCENLPYIDLNYLNVNNKPKTKTLSQIDKFNKRYNQKRS